MPRRKPPPDTAGPDVPPTPTPSVEQAVFTASAGRGAGNTADAGVGDPIGPGRAWTQRHQQPLAYRRFTLKDERGGDNILFLFHLPPGDTRPPVEALDVMRAHKYWKADQPYGLAPDAKSNDESYTTGLTFGSNPKHPKAWVLPNTEFGRVVADSIDRALDGLARRVRESPERPGR